MSLRLRILYSRRRLSTITEWNESQIIIDRRSKFQARHVDLENPSDIPIIISQFLAQNKSIAKNASHPHILAWRTGEALVLNPLKGSQEITYSDIQQGFKDCGEKGAGSKILDILISQGVMNKLVIVTRWFGGSHIGSSRFRHIVNCSSESLRKGATTGRR